MKRNCLSNKNVSKPKRCWNKICYCRTLECSHKLSKNIRQAVKEGLNSSLYSDTKKVKNRSTKKM